MSECYPERLLPSVDKVSRVSYQDSCFLCRRSDVNFELTFTEDGKINPIAFDLKQLFDLSTNLVNILTEDKKIEGFFSDVLFKFIKKDKDYSFDDWCGDDSLIPKLSELNFEYLRENSFIVIPIDRIKNFKSFFPFKKNEKNSIEKTYSLELNINFQPTMINVLHFTLKPVSDVVESKFVMSGSFSSKEGYRYQIITKLKEFIEENALKKDEIQFLLQKVNDH